MPAAPLPKQEAQIPKGGEINAGAGRTIVREDSGQVTVRHDDTERFRQLGGNVDVVNGRDGTTTTTVNRPGGVQVVTVKDRDGNILQRYRKDRNGQIEVLIGDAGPQRWQPPPAAATRGTGAERNVRLPGPAAAAEAQHPARPVYRGEQPRLAPSSSTQAFEAPPVENVERALLARGDPSQRPHPQQGAPRRFRHGHLRVRQRRSAGRPDSADAGRRRGHARRHRPAPRPGLPDRGPHRRGGLGPGQPGAVRPPRAKRSRKSSPTISAFRRRTS